MTGRSGAWSGLGFAVFNLALGLVSGRRLAGAECLGHRHLDAGVPGRRFPGDPQDDYVLWRAGALWRDVLHD